jgi:hypothetical protein
MILEIGTLNIMTIIIMELIFNDTHHNASSIMTQHSTLQNDIYDYNKKHNYTHKNETQHKRKRHPAVSQLT